MIYSQRKKIKISDFDLELDNNEHKSNSDGQGHDKGDHNAAMAKVKW